MNAITRIDPPAGSANGASHPTVRPRRPADHGDRLARALTADAAHVGCRITLSVLTFAPWSSGLFDGSTVTLRLTAPTSPALSAWLADLPERDVPMGRDIVADIAVAPMDGAWRVTALVCRDATTVRS